MMFNKINSCELVGIVPTCDLHVQVHIPVGLLNLSIIFTGTYIHVLNHCPDIMFPSSMECYVKGQMEVCHHKVLIVFVTEIAVANPKCPKK